MEDCVLYAPPLGAIGRLANRVFVAPALTRIFQYRGDVIRLLPQALAFNHRGFEAETLSHDPASGVKAWLTTLELTCVALSLPSIFQTMALRDLQGRIWKLENAGKAKTALPPTLGMR